MSKKQSELSFDRSSIDETGNAAISTATQRTGKVILGRTLPSLMDEACERNPNPKAFNQRTTKGWKPLSTTEFCSRSEALALGLLGLELARGDRVALFMESDVNFCLADMACLIAGLVDAPIYTTHGETAIRYVMEHTEARALIVSNLQAIDQLSSFLPELSRLQTILVAEAQRERLLERRAALHSGVALLSMEEVEAFGRHRLEKDPKAPGRLKAEIHPHDLATIVYTSGTTGTQKGVMLTHENISFNVLACFSGLGDPHPHPTRVAISFLPLTHAFARMMHYGYLNYGISVYFTEPELLDHDLKQVRPTIFAAVPRVLEKLYDKILHAGAELGTLKRSVFRWALGLARNDRLGVEKSRLRALQQPLADRLVYSRWREALGGRVEYIICGGAALRQDLTNVFATAGISVLQGYGLTETSPVISFNRPHFNRAGTVGTPLVGVEVAIAADGEILTRGPHVMKGYYRNPQATREAIDEQNWFHTGDIGEFTPEGLLKITDRKKDLFKLSTGKYVMPQPLENRLRQDPIVDHAVVLGAGRKFCAALIFPNLKNLETYALRKNLDGSLPPARLLQHPAVVTHFQRLVEESNRELPHWSQVKRFRLLASHLTVENGLLTPTLKVRRRQIQQHFHAEIEQLYQDPGAAAESGGQSGA